MLHAQRRRSAPGRGRYLSGIAQPQPPHAAICVWRHRVMQETGERDRSCIQREIPNFPFTFEHKGRSSSDSRLSGDRNRLTGGSQSISKCAREIRRTVSQFLNGKRAREIGRTTRPDFTIVYSRFGDGPASAMNWLSHGHRTGLFYTALSLVSVTGNESYQWLVCSKCTSLGVAVCSASQFAF